MEVETLALMLDGRINLKLYKDVMKIRRKNG